MAAKVLRTHLLRGDEKYLKYAKFWLKNTQIRGVFGQCRHICDDSI
jgi:hypothetical protein